MKKEIRRSSKKIYRKKTKLPVIVYCKTRLTLQLYKTIKVVDLVLIFIAKL